MTMVKNDTVLGVFEDQNHALQAIKGLRQAGFLDEQLGLACRQWVAEVPDNVDVHAQQNAGEGAVTGAVLGGGLGAAAGAVAAGLIPGVGPILATGLLGAALGGAALGAAVGAFAGPFVALGLTESDAQHYAHHIEAGRTVVLVRTHDRQEIARDILKEHGAYSDSMRAT